MNTEIQDTKNRDKLQSWLAEMEACNASGMAVRQWCEEKGISVEAYYYHRRRVREATQAESQIVPLGVQRLSDKIEITSDDIRISLPAGCSVETLQAVLRALKDVT